jgi:DNA polymerase III subunit alpha, Gram-positive type
MYEKYLVGFDLETTGVKKTDGITEIGAVKFDLNGKFIDSFNSFCNPLIKIPKNIQEITGITDDMIKNALHPVHVIEKFYQWLGDKQNCILFAHNASFDVHNISYTLEKKGINYENYKVIDTLKWSRLKINSKKHNLDCLCEHIGYQNKNSHRAKNDSLAVMKLVNFLIKNHENINNKKELWKFLQSKSLSFDNILKKK